MTTVNANLDPEALARLGLRTVDLAVMALEATVKTSESGARPEGVVRCDPKWFLEVEVARVRASLERVLMGRHPDEGLDALLEVGALELLLPEINAMVGFGDGEWRHKDVWKHTKQVVRQAVPRTEVRWAALLHDIGKIKTRRIEPNGEVHFFGHAEVGASMFDRLQRRLPLFKGEDALSSSVRFLILHHLRASQYDDSWTDSAVRRFAKEMGGCMGDLLDLSRADITTKRPEKKRRGLEAISELAARVRQIQDEDARVPPLPKGVGTAISATFGIAPSPRLGELMKKLKEAVEGGELDAQREAEYYLEWLRASGLVGG
ncbi:MAG: HDIG domain-containing protein [Myxococcales bacterium]|nr:HDIG domain-containing protein [Myxococcales bacterium]